MSWVNARAALKNQVNGTQVTVSDLVQETMVAYEYAPPGRQDLDHWPYAFVWPTPVRVVRGANGLKTTRWQPVVRVLLAPRGTDDMETLQKRYDAWVQALSDAFDDAVSLDGAVTVFTEQSIGPLTPFDDIDTGWGFEIEFGDVVEVTSATYSA